MVEANDEERNEETRRVVALIGCARARRTHLYLAAGLISSRWEHTAVKEYALLPGPSFLTVAIMVTVLTVLYRRAIGARAREVPVTERTHSLGITVASRFAVYRLGPLILTLQFSCQRDMSDTNQGAVAHGIFLSKETTTSSLFGNRPGYQLEYLSGNRRNPVTRATYMSSTEFART
jgi:hypothetical protein